MEYLSESGGDAGVSEWRQEMQEDGIVMEVKHFQTFREANAIFRRV